MPTLKKTKKTTVLPKNYVVRSSSLERPSMVREVRGSNPALGVRFARIKRLFYQFTKLLSLREIRGCFYRFATKRRWISRGGSLFKIINDCINVADEKDCRIR